MKKVDSTRIKYNLKAFQNIDELNIAAAQLIIARAKEAIATKGRFTIVLSGGYTPLRLYSLLAKSPWREQIEWTKTFIFFGDERYVVFDSVKNNAHQIKSILFDKIAIPASNIYIIPVNFLPGEGALQYEKKIKSFFKNEPVRFDLVLLGLGENGHTASLFPGTAVLTEKTAGIRQVYVHAEKMYRITMTAPLINQAHHILFIVTGERKKKILKSVLTGPYQPQKYPAQLIQPKDGQLCWFVNRSAAELII
jgi:6-phosphogluconolactonase